jgi:ferrous iron transport protein B
LAREVFVGTLATIYSVSTGNEDTIKKIKWPQKSIHGKEGVQLASGISLLLFCAFALQCASTIAITRKETNS